MEGEEEREKERGRERERVKERNVWGETAVFCCVEVFVVVKSAQRRGDRSGRRVQSAVERESEGESV